MLTTEIARFVYATMMQIIKQKLICNNVALNNLKQGLGGTARRDCSFILYLFGMTKYSLIQLATFIIILIFFITKPNIIKDLTDSFRFSCGNH